MTRRGNELDRLVKYKIAGHDLRAFGLVYDGAENAITSAAARTPDAV